MPTVAFGPDQQLTEDLPAVTYQPLPGRPRRVGPAVVAGWLAVVAELAFVAAMVRVDLMLWHW